MPVPGTGWRNSILARTLILVIGMMLLYTAVSLGMLMLGRQSPERGTMTTYEIARVFRNQPVAISRSSITVVHALEVPARSTDRTAELLAQALAQELGRPADAVRIRLGARPQWPADAIERERRLYGADGKFVPGIIGSFAAAVRDPKGGWTVVSRGMRDPFYDWIEQALFWFFGWLIVVTPVAFWFSSRLTRPIRAFSAAAERMGRGDATPIPVVGPTEIRLAAETLNDMQARLLRYVAERTSVVGAIAHDLRAPLSRLNFHLATAPDALYGRAQREIEEMEQLIRVTLDFVHSETHPRGREPIDLALLVEGVVDNFADAGQPVTLGEAVPVTIEGDHIVLKRMFGNLIDNAVKYGSRATVTVRHEPGFAVVDIEDQGAGMKPEDIDRAFEPFYRAERSRNRRTGGVGLGLSIVRFAVEAHGGTVALSNREHGGLRAQVRLPA